jgi:hypothetical protein
MHVPAQGRVEYLIRSAQLAEATIVRTPTLKYIHAVKTCLSKHIY